MSEVELEQLVWCKKCGSYRGLGDGIIYKITDLDTKKYYIGSSKHTLDCRVKGHKRLFESFKKGKSYYCASYEILESDNYKVDVIEQYPCNTKKELERREGELIKEGKLNGGYCVNLNIPGRTNKEYYQDNRDKLNALQKKYREDNREYYKEYRKEWQKDNREYRKKYDKEYREENRDKIAVRYKKWQKDNPEKIKVSQKKYYESINYYVQCECGRSVKKRCLSGHKKSQIHQQWEQDQSN